MSRRINVYDIQQYSSNFFSALELAILGALVTYVAYVVGPPVVRALTALSLTPEQAIMAFFLGAAAFTAGFATKRAFRQEELIEVDLKTRSGYFLASFFSFLGGEVLVLIWILTRA